MSIRSGQRGKGPEAKRLKIAVFNHGLPVTGRKVPGVDRVAHDLAQGLARRGHQVTVWTWDPKPEGALYEVRRLPARSFAQSWLGKRLTAGYLGNLFSLLPDYREADVVIAHGDSLLLALTRKPIVRVMHGSALGEARHATRLVRRVLQSGIYLQELATAALTPYTVGVSHNTLDDNPFVRRVIPNGVDLSVFHPGEKTAHPSLLFVGTLAGRKRGSTLLEWFDRKIRPAVQGSTLEMVSERGLGMDGVTYRPGVSEAQLAALYRRSWVVASPSTYEGFGLPYLEAMASGAAVVATPNPGSRELLEGGAGVLANDGEFGEAVVKVLHDPAERSRLIAAGLARAREYSLERTLDRYEALLAELI